MTTWSSVTRPDDITMIPGSGRCHGPPGRHRWYVVRCGTPHASS